MILMFLSCWHLISFVCCFLGLFSSISRKHIHSHIPRTTINHIYLKFITGPGWCGSEDWVPASKPKGHRLDSQSGHVPGFRARSPGRGVWEATTHGCFPPSLSLPLSKNTLNYQNNKNKMKCITGFVCILKILNILIFLIFFKMVCHHYILIKKKIWMSKNKELLMEITRKITKFKIFISGYFHS